MARCTRCGAQIGAASWCSSCGLMQSEPSTAGGSAAGPTTTAYGAATPNESSSWTGALVATVAIAAVGVAALFIDAVDSAVFALWESVESVSHSVAHPFDWFHFGSAILFALLAGVPLGLFAGGGRSKPGLAMLGPIGALFAWPVILVLHDIVHELKWGLDNDDLGGTFGYLLWEPSYIYTPGLTLLVAVIVAVSTSASSSA